MSLHNNSLLDGSVLDAPAETPLVLGKGTAMEALNALVAEIAPTDISVLLVGESGTGKDTYAKFIHRLSEGRLSEGRSPASIPGIGQPALRKVSCATLDSTHLLRQVQDGIAAGGEDHASCMFLDGVEDLDLPTQRALASLLPEGESQTGDTRKVRLICATSTNLERAIEAGRFRRELYFRINGATLRLPPLRERTQDIPALVEHFLAKYPANARTPLVPDHETMELLISHTWPGNIRELENIVKKMAAFADPKSAVSELRAAPRVSRRMENSAEGKVSSLKVAARAASRRTERELILKALERTHWNRKRAAQELQISYKSLLYKIKQIEVPGSGPDEL